MTRPEWAHRRHGAAAIGHLLPASVRVTALGGALATALVAVGGSLAGGAGPVVGWWWSVPPVPVRPLVSVVPAVALFYGGLILLCRFWGRLRREAGDLRPRTVLAVFLIWSLPLLLAPPLGSRDVYAYVAAGEVVEAGLDPYEVGPAALAAGREHLEAVDPTWREAPSPYGPLFVGASAAVAATTSAVPPSVLLLRLLALGGLLLAAWGLTRLAGPQRAPLALALVLANPLVLLHLVSGAHNEALMLGLLVTGLAVGERHPHAGMVLCALAAAVKAPALLGVAYLGWTAVLPGAPHWQRLLSTASAMTVAVATLVVAGRLSGLGWGWLHTVDGARDVLAYLAPTTVLGLLLGHLTGDGAAVGTVQAFGVAVALVATTVLLVRSHRTGLAGLGVALLLVAVLGPVVQPWYLAWGGAVLAAATTPRRLRWLVAGSVGLSFTVLPAGPDLGHLVLDEPVAMGVALSALALLVAVTSPSAAAALRSARSARRPVPFLAPIGSGRPGP